MRIYTADCREQEKNTRYPHEVTISTAADLAGALQNDNMVSKMAGSVRDSKNFLQCDCVMFDVDNTHSEDPDAWKTADDIAETFPVKYYLVRSRNYMKAKRKIDKQGRQIVYEPREKWHVYLPLKKTIRQPAEHEELMQNLLALFPYIDPSAIDAARFFYGIEHPHVIFEDAELCIDEYIDNANPAALKEAQIAAITDYAEQVRQGLYKNDKGSQTAITKVCLFLGISNPLQLSPNTQPDPAGQSGGEDVPAWIINAEQTKTEQWLQNWASQYNVYLGRRYEYNRAGEGRTIAYCVACPWEAEHSMNGADNEAVIMIDPHGVLAFLCRHSHGGVIGWKDYRAYYENKYKAENDSSPGPVTGVNQDVELRPDNTRDYIDNLMTAELDAFRQQDLRTGFDNLDEKTHGLYSGLYVLAAGSSLGKTTLALQLADQIAEGGTDVIYFSLEQSRLELVTKSISRRTYQKNPEEAATSISIRSGYLSTAVLDAFREYKEAVADRLSIIEGNFDTDISFIGNYIRRYVKRNNVRPVVFLDYLQILQPSEEMKRATTKEVVDFTVTELKRLSRDLGLVIIAICSLNRANYLLPVDFESLKESGSIEYSADVVWGLQLKCLNEELFSKEGKIKEKRARVKECKLANPREIELVCLKNRFGISSYSCFFNYNPRYDLYEEGTEAAQDFSLPGRTRQITRERI